MSSPRRDFEVSHPSPARDRVSGLRLLAATTLAPLAWLAQLTASYFFSSETCWVAPGGTFSSTLLWIILLILNVLFAGIGLLGFYLAYSCWTRSRGEKKGGKEELLQVGEGRTRFAALSALIISGIFFVAIFAEAAALFILQECAPGSWM